MRFAHAQQGMINASSFLKPIIQNDNTEIQAKDKVISWRGRKPGIVKGLYYPLEYQYLLDNHQYSLLLSDGSFFQIFYQFDNDDTLKSARLAFYPKPLSTQDNADQLMDAAQDAIDREDDELYEHLYNWTELMEYRKIAPSNTSHIRFDYDHKAKTHAPAHLQLSGLHEFRVEANYFPQPLAFIQLCEMSYSGIRSLGNENLRFERGHSLALEQPSDLISLSWPNQV